MNEIFAQCCGPFVASAGNGGAISGGDINSGGNVGNAIGVGNSYMDPVINGGSVSNNTGLGLAANGGTGIADASGGNYNLAFVS